MRKFFRKSSDFLHHLLDKSCEGGVSMTTATDMLVGKVADVDVQTTGGTSRAEEDTTMHHSMW